MTLQRIKITWISPYGKTAALALGLCLAAPAWAEWIPPACCPERDCSLAELREVQEVDGGFRVAGIAEVIAYDDPRLQPSLDGRWHVCKRSDARPGMDATQSFHAGQAQHLKCLFVPMTG